MKKEKIDKKLFKLNLKRAWRYIRKYKKYIIIYIALTFIDVGIGIILPLISAKQILYLSNGLFSELLLTALALLLINIISQIIGYFSSYCNDYINDAVTNKIQVDLVREFFQLNISDIDKQSTGTFIEMINYDASGMSYIFFRLIGEVRSILSKLGTIVTIFILNKFVFVYFIIVAIITFIIGEIRNKAREKHWKKMRELREEKYNIITESVRGIRDIKVLNAKTSVTKKIKEKITNVTKEEFTSNRYFNKLNIVSSLMSDIMNFGFLVLGIILCNKGLLTVSTFLILYNYRGTLEYLFLGITNFASSIKEFNFSASRVFDVIDGINYQKEKFGNRNFKKLKGNIEFKDVSFSYDGKKNILKDINFTIEPNEIVGFVGKSGAGKSTIFNLITKLYEINKGSILLDGIDINDLSESALRDNMAIITQNPYIFNFSVKDNLLIANPKASMKEIRNACKLACIDDFFMELEDKYDTKLGENGLILSGGQKQRLAIARALLNKTEIILFDEATSALDNETQEEIQKAIRNLKGKYTILIIAHRLSTVLDSNKIIVIDDGKIAGIGTHKELMDNNKIYKRLYKKEML